MRTVEVKLFKFDELDDKAKGRAIEWWRQLANNDSWWEYDDFIECAKRLGIVFDQKKGRGPAIWFSGFWSQGDGACFEGHWSYKPDAVSAITTYAPDDDVLKKIAETLHDVQNANPTIPLTAKVTHRDRYYHSRSVDIEVFDDTTGNLADVPADHAKEISEALRDFMDWMYNRLEEQYEHYFSDETISENIRANDYEFYANGDRARDV